MTYTICKSIDIDFAHQVHGHAGPCINIHGHTWKFECRVKAESLDNMNMVADFGDLKRQLLQPIHTMLDHGFAIYDKTLEKMQEPLSEVGRIMVATRGDTPGSNRWYCHGTTNPPIAGARDIRVGGIKVVTFPFPPTSETLAKWLYDAATEWAVDRFCVSIAEARVYETLHPVESWASYSP